MKEPPESPEPPRPPGAPPTRPTAGPAWARGPLAHLLPVPLILQVALSLAFVAGVGLVAIGASGALAAGVGAVAGTSFVSGDSRGVTYTPDRCADFREYHPEAATCAEAAVAHHFDEVVGYRLAAGILGLVVLAGTLVARRTRLGSLGAGMLPEGFTATVGTTAFGLAAAGLFGLSLPQIAMGWPDGAGAYLTGGLVALAPLAAFGLSLRRSLLERVAAASPPPVAA